MLAEHGAEFEPSAFDETIGERVTEPLGAVAEHDRRAQSDAHDDVVPGEEPSPSESEPQPDALVDHDEAPRQDDADETPEDDEAGTDGTADPALATVCKKPSRIIRWGQRRTNRLWPT